MCNHPTIVPLEQAEEYGKPGMNDEGATQVAKPDSCGSSCTKLYMCKIDCGETAVDECTHVYGINSLYNFLQCRGACTHYNIAYGCSMEAGCDTPCWDDYKDKCGPDAYEDCIEGCENVFGDCNS